MTDSVPPAVAIREWEEPHQSGGTGTAWPVDRIAVAWDTPFLSKVWIEMDDHLVAKHVEIHPGFVTSACREILGFVP